MTLQPDIHKTLYIWPAISMWDQALPGSDRTRYSVLRWLPAVRRFRHVGVADTMYDADVLMQRIERRAHRRRAPMGKQWPFRRFIQCRECSGSMRSTSPDHIYCRKCEQEWIDQPWY